MKGEKWTSLELEVFENHATKPSNTLQKMLFSLFGKKRTIQAINQQKYLHTKKNKTT